MQGQLSLFDGFIEKPNEKPAIGTIVIFHYNGKDYPARVQEHSYTDSFIVIFIDRRPCDDNADMQTASGWHLNMRGYGEKWSELEK